MNILSVHGASKSHGTKQLFSDVSLGIDERDRIGVIGPNGSGKSTLLRILAGDEPADAGTIARRADLRVEFLDQKPDFPRGCTALGYVLAGEGELMTVVREYEAVSMRLESHEDASHPDHETLLRRQEELSHRMDLAGGWELEARARLVLGRLGVRDPDAEVSTLSGGYRKRVALARALLAPADLLILDEPTNHLDVEMIDWLESWLQKFPGAVLLVTHDRYFLDRVTRVILEIDRGSLRRFDGNFSYYLERKAELEEIEASTDKRRRGILRNELAWLKKGAKARTTKQKARIDRYHDLADQVEDRTVETLAFRSGARRLGGRILEMENVEKRRGDRLCVTGFSYAMPRGERVGIVGPNGAGKTTLLELMTGGLEPDSGTVLRGETVVFGYFDQESRGLNPDERAIDYVKREGGEMIRSPEGDVRTVGEMMERFLFTPQMQYAPVGLLSGGERRRLYLVRTLMRDPNVLVLDEPTNDLDIATLQSLEDYLDDFAGCLIVVSHDRYFLDRTVERVLAPAGDGRWELLPGGWESYARRRAERREAERTARAGGSGNDGAVGAGGGAGAAGSSGGAVATGATGATASGKRLSYKESKELEGLEREIEALEARLEALGAEVAGSGADFARMRVALEEQTNASRRLEEAMARWEELATRAEQGGRK